MEIPAKMKAVFLHEFQENPTLTLEEVPVPEVHKNEVLIEVIASPLLLQELLFIQGNHNSIRHLPVVPGFEGSGKVIKAGPGASSLKGKRVSFILFEESRIGAWAQFVVCSAKQVAILNENVDYFRGSMMMVNPLTVLMLHSFIKKERSFIQTDSSSLIGRLSQRYANHKKVKCINVVKTYEEKSMLECEEKYVLCEEDSEFDDELSEMLKHHKPQSCFDGLYDSTTFKILSLMPEKSTLYCHSELHREGALQINPEELNFKKKSVKGLSLKVWLNSLTSSERKSVFKQLDKFHSLFLTDIEMVFETQDVMEAYASVKGQTIPQTTVLIMASTEQGYVSSRPKASLSEIPDQVSEEEQIRKIISYEIFEIWEEFQFEEIQHGSLIHFPYGLYKGQINDSLPHGKGVMYYSENCIYYGDWAEGKKNGEGFYLAGSGETFSGRWVNDKKNGKIEYTANGIRYMTEYAEDELKRVLKVKFEDAEYIGEFENLLPHGKGCLAWDEKENYTGEFVGGEIFGKGVLELIGKKFEGTFQEGNAEGKMTYEDGSLFVGKLENWKEHGEGELIKEGVTEKVVWEHGSLVKLKKSPKSSSSSSPKIERRVSEEEVEIEVEKVVEEKILVEKLKEEEIKESEIKFEGQNEKPVKIDEEKVVEETENEIYANEERGIDEPAFEEEKVEVEKHSSSSKKEKSSSSSKKKSSSSSKKKSSSSSSSKKSSSKENYQRSDEERPIEEFGEPEVSHPSQEIEERELAEERIEEAKDIEIVESRSSSSSSN